jgi:hypothetical protein
MNARASYCSGCSAISHSRLKELCLAGGQAEPTTRQGGQQHANLTHYGTAINLAAYHRWEDKVLAYSETKRPVVLIVEDEFLIRMDAVDMIRSAGFDVAEAENADEAIFILEGRPDITVVFTDIQMPGSMERFGDSAFVAQAGERCPLDASDWHFPELLNGL